MPLNWQLANVPGSGYWTAVAFSPGLGRFLIVTSYSTASQPWNYLTSTDGINWTGGTDTVLDSGQWQGVGALSDRFVVVRRADNGSNGAAFGYPSFQLSNNLSWVSSGPSFVGCFNYSNYALGIVSGGTAYSNGALSTDGQTWTLSVNGVGMNQSGLMLGGNPVGVSLGLNFTRYSSTDLLNWSTGSWNMSLSLNCGAFWNGKWIGGGNLAIVTSTDSVNFSSISIPLTPMRMATAPGLAVAISATGTVAGGRVVTSPDGLAWTQESAGPVDALPIAGSMSSQYNTLAYGNGAFVGLFGTGTTTTVAYALAGAGAASSMLTAAAIS